MSRSVGLILALVAFWARPANAGLCGDDVQGQDVPCACGDVVVSDLRLADDPVLAAPCASDGLIVDARTAQTGLTIDLQGQTLRGLGRGAGIRVLYGGPNGAYIVSTGNKGGIDGFEDGVAGHGVNAVAVIENLSIRGAHRDGIQLHGASFEVRSTDVSDAGRDAFSVNGQGYRLQQTRAINSGRYGYLIMGTDAELGLPGKGIAAFNGVKAGIVVLGADHRFADCLASGNLDDGLRLMGVRYQLAGCVAEGNRRDGINGTGSGWWLINNRATDNGNDGIAVRGIEMHDGGLNQGSGNRGEQQQGKNPVQCMVGAAPCIQ
jgi:hypothetical protein